MAKLRGVMGSWTQPPWGLSRRIGDEAVEQVIALIVGSVPRDATHRTRAHLHFTPTSASWLDLVERWFGLLTDRRIRRGARRCTAELEKAILDEVYIHNEHPNPFIWTRTVDEILDS